MNATSALQSRLRAESRLGVSRLRRAGRFRRCYESSRSRELNARGSMSSERGWSDAGPVLTLIAV